MRPLSLAPILLAIGLLAGCSEQPTSPGQPVPGTPPSFAILDGAHGGSQQFYFLPPMVPAPSYSGTFDPSLSPVVTICELAGNSCGATIASFSGSAVKLDLTAEAYVAIWKTKDAGLDPTKTYRIQVLVGANLLGYADVVVLSNGSQIKTVDKNQFVSVINGGVLKIRFRIEGGAPPPPPPGPWQNGDLVTYNQQNWGSIGTAASNLLENYFITKYPNGVEVGVSGAGGNSAIFTTVDAVLSYQPASGDPAPLSNDLVDPTSTSSGSFGGDVLALQFDVDFSDLGVLSGSASLNFGDLRVCGLTVTTNFNNMTVSQVLGQLNQALGGAVTPYSYDDLALLAQNLTQSFESGSVSQFAQDHLVNGACPGGWQNGDLVTYSQDGWGTIGTPASNLLVNSFFTVLTSGVAEIGIPAAAGFSAIFTSAEAVLDYLPANGLPDALENDLLDPMSTASGVFGGYVLALLLDVAFTDAGLLSGTAPLRFGDLRLCGLTATPAYNNLTVRQFLAAMNTALGGGPGAYSFDEMANLTDEVSRAFEGGTPSSFAQDHLISGTCPGGWQNGALVTYIQGEWGDATTTAGVLLNNSFNALYGALGYVEAGIPGAAGFSMLFTSAGAVFTYQPASGASAPLNADLIDPTSTASGIFGGEVLALRFNIDLSDADFLSGTTSVDIGNLTLCGLAQSGLNGTTVRAFQDVANTALGGGSTPFAIADLNGIASNINAAFSGGAVSLFAQANLFNGPCP